MAEVHLKKNVERRISDAAIEYARTILSEKDNQNSDTLPVSHKR